MSEKKEDFLITMNPIFKVLYVLGIPLALLIWIAIFIRLEFIFWRERATGMRNSEEEAYDKGWRWNECVCGHCYVLPSGGLIYI